MKVIKAASPLLALGLIAGCGGGTATHAARPAVSATSAAPTATPTVGPDGFIAAVRRSGAGSKDLSGQAAAKVLIDIGTRICDGLDTDLSYADSVNVVIKSLRSITVRQATVVVDAATRGLCPGHADQLPKNAP